MDDNTWGRNAVPTSGGATRRSVRPTRLADDAPAQTDPNAGNWGAQTARSVLGNRANDLTSGVEYLARGVMGDDEGRIKAAKAYQAEAERVKTTGPRIQSLDDAQAAGGGVGDYAAYGAYALADMVPDIAMTATGVGVGGTLARRGARKAILGGIASEIEATAAATAARETAIKAATRRAALEAPDGAAAVSNAMKVARAETNETFRKAALQEAVEIAGRTPRGAQIAGRVGGMVGGTLAGMPTLNGQENAELAAKESTSQSDMWALAAGTAAASATQVLPIERFIGKFGAKARAEVAEKADGFLSRTAKEMLTQGGFEGSQEVLQQALQNASQAWVAEDPQRLYGPEAFKQYAASFVVGGVLGGVMGGAGEGARAVGGGVATGAKAIGSAGMKGVRFTKELIKDRLQKAGDAARSIREGARAGQEIPLDGGDAPAKPGDEAATSWFRKAADAVAGVGEGVIGAAQSAADRFRKIDGDMTLRDEVEQSADSIFNAAVANNGSLNLPDPFRSPSATAHVFQDPWENIGMSYVSDDALAQLDAQPEAMRVVASAMGKLFTGGELTAAEHNARDWLRDSGGIDKQTLNTLVVFGQDLSGKHVTVDAENEAELQARRDAANAGIQEATAADESAEPTAMELAMRDAQRTQAAADSDNIGDESVDDNGIDNTQEDGPDGPAQGEYQFETEQPVGTVRERFSTLQRSEADARARVSAARTPQARELARQELDGIRGEVRAAAKEATRKLMGRPTPDQPLGVNVWTGKALDNRASFNKLIQATPLRVELNQTGTFEFTQDGHPRQGEKIPAPLALSLDSIALQELGENYAAYEGLKTQKERVLAAAAEALMDLSVLGKSIKPESITTGEFKVKNGESFTVTESDVKALRQAAVRGRKNTKRASKWVQPEGPATMAGAARIAREGQGPTKNVWEDSSDGPGIAGREADRTDYTLRPRVGPIKVAGEATEALVGAVTGDADVSAEDAAASTARTDAALAAVATKLGAKVSASQIISVDPDITKKGAPTYKVGDGSETAMALVKADGVPARRMKVPVHLIGFDRVESMKARGKDQARSRNNGSPMRAVVRPHDTKENRAHEEAQLAARQKQELAEAKATVRDQSLALLQAHPKLAQAVIADNYDAMEAAYEHNMRNHPGGQGKFSREIAKNPVRQLTRALNSRLSDAIQASVVERVNNLPKATEADIKATDPAKLRTSRQAELIKAAQRLMDQPFPPALLERALQRRNDKLRGIDPNTAEAARASEVKLSKDAERTSRAQVDIENIAARVDSAGGKSGYGDKFSASAEHREAQAKADAAKTKAAAKELAGRKKRRENPKNNIVTKAELRPTQESSNAAASKAEAAKLARQRDTSGEGSRAPKAANPNDGLTTPVSVKTVDGTNAAFTKREAADLAKIRQAATKAAMMRYNKAAKAAAEARKAAGPIAPAAETKGQDGQFAIPIVDGIANWGEPDAAWADAIIAALSPETKAVDGELTSQSFIDLDRRVAEYVAAHPGVSDAGVLALRARLREEAQTAATNPYVAERVFKTRVVAHVRNNLAERAAADLAARKAKWEKLRTDDEARKADVKAKADKAAAAKEKRNAAAKAKRAAKKAPATPVAVLENTQNNTSAIVAGAESVHAETHDLKKEEAMLNAVLDAMGVDTKVTVQDLENADEEGFSGGSYRRGDHEIRISPFLRGAERVEVLMHELGHHILYNEIAKIVGWKALKEYDITHTAAIDIFAKHAPELHAAIKIDFDKWVRDGRQSQSPTHRALSGIARDGARDFSRMSEGVQFHEYVADNIARALTQQRKPVSMIEKFFSSLAKQFRQAWQILTAAPNMRPAPSIDAWVRNMFNGNVSAVRSATGVSTSTAAAASIVDAATSVLAPKGSKRKKGTARAPKDAPNWPEIFHGQMEYVRNVLPSAERLMLERVLSRPENMSKLEEYSKTYWEDKVPGITQKMTDAKVGMETKIAMGYLAYQSHQFTRPGVGAKQVFTNWTDNLVDILGASSEAVMVQRVFEDWQSGRIEQLVKRNDTYSVRELEAKANGTSQRVFNWLAKPGPVSNAMASFWTGINSRMYDTGVPAMRRLAALLQRPQGTTNDDDRGLIPAVRTQTLVFHRKFTNVLKGLTEKETELMFTALQRRAVAGEASFDKKSPKLQKAIGDMRALMSEAFGYGSAKDVGMFEDGRQAQANYFPVMMDIADDSSAKKLGELYSKPAFREAILDKFNVKGKDRTNEQHAKLVQLMVNAAMDGDMAADTKPAADAAFGVRADKQRFSDFIYTNGTEADRHAFAKLQTKNPDEIFARYFNPLVKAAEARRRFGERVFIEDENGDPVISKKTGQPASYVNPRGKLDKMLAQIKDQGGTDADVTLAENAVKAAMGTYGSDMSPTLSAISPDLAKKFSGPRTKAFIQNAQAYQNIRLLPLALLSSLVDPMGIAVRSGGDFNASFAGFKSGMRSLFNKKHAAEMHAMLEELGLADDFMPAIASHPMFEEGEKGFARRVSEGVFKFNGMNAWVQANRVMAAHAGSRFLLHHAASTEADSKRYLAELSITPADIKADKDGKLILNDKTKAALQQFVDEAILRPNALQAPLWHRDPYMGMVTQYKAFSYAIYDQISKRISLEFSNGNYRVLLAAMAYLPVAMMAELLREFIQYAGEGNPRREEWGAGEYTMLAAERTGLPGPKYDITTNLKGDIERRNIPGTSQLGPTGGQANNLIDAFTGRRSIPKEIESALPLSALTRKWNDGNDAADPKQPLTDEAA